jgi:glycosyl hydrolase family 42 (putative beta-galactosidase)
MKRIFAIVLAALVAAPLARAEDAGLQPGAFHAGEGYVWIEAENFASETFTATKGRWAVREGEGFANGAHVVANARPSPTGEHIASWTFRADAAGEYELWARIGWRHWCDHEWKLDDGEWNTASTVGGLYEFFKVPVEGGVSEVAWMTYGKVTLSPGEHKLSIRLKVPEGRSGAQQFFDCFCFSRAPFVPMGKYRPDERVAIHPGQGSPAGKDWWAFRPAYPLDEETVLDFAFLNDPIGVHGFVTMKDGDLFFADGTPVRFWGTNASYWGSQLIYMEKLDADRYADFLAHLGVNCVRIHVLHSTNSLMDASRNDTQHMDPVKLDRLDYLLHALSKRGIYVNIDLMYHRTFREGDNIDPELIPPASRERNPQYNPSWACGAAAFWHPRAIELNLAFYRNFLTHVNPYTKKSLVESPQMAMVTIQNEQSILWGTTNVRKGRTAEILDEIFTSWLKNKYATQAKLEAAWGVEGRPAPLAEGESLDAGMKLGKVLMSATGLNRNRALDQKRFLYDMEIGFYRRWIDAMHNWGVKCPIITSNWRGAGNTTRLVLQASTLGEIVDRHNYFTRPQSMITAIGRGLPMTGFEQQAKRAFSISEWNHGTDGRFGAETVPLMATVAAIQGWDALFHFNSRSVTWETGLGGLGVVPQHAVLYPLASMIWRRGDIQTGPVVFERRRDPEYQFGRAREARVMSTDPAAATGEKSSEPTPVPPEILAIGRVQNAYTDQPEPDLYREALVDKCWDRQGKTVTSAGGDVRWGYGTGCVVLDSPRTQGAFGALAGQAIACKDVSIESPNAHATILVTSLDGEPISESRRLLVAAVGRSAPNAITPGARATAPPCLMEPALGSVSIATDLRKVSAVSATGYKLADIAPTRAGGKLTFDLTDRPQVVYYLIEAEPTE